MHSRKNVYLPSEPEAPPPDWWARVFHRRQHTLRCLIAHHLDGAAETPAKGLTTTQLRSCLPRFETAEIDHALAQMLGQGVIEERIRTAWPARGVPRPEMFWAIPAAPQEGGA